jgi:fibronectin type 3 domain-containing protein
VEYYIIERKTLEDDEWKKVARLRGRLQAEFIEEGLKDKNVYRYRVRVETFDGIVSTPSETVKVVTKPLPPQITGLQATTDLPKKIFLTWNKSNYKDFERYYLYRSDRKDGKYELIAKLYNNRFTDEIGKDGIKYFYKISQKDVDGLESKKDDFIVMGSTLPKPAAPTLKEAKFDGSRIVLEWFKTDPRSKSYIVERHAKTGWFDEKVERFKTTQKQFVDKNITPNTKYSYIVYAVDANGIVSEPSAEVSVDVKEVKMGAMPKQHTTQNSPKTEQSKPQTEVIAPVEGLDVDSQ